jgi:hypothetical protein
VLTQLAPQVVVPVGHMAVHCEPEQKAAVAGQTMPHAPQFRPSLLRFAQVCPHAV